jgi:hypothetical protein
MFPSFPILVIVLSVYKAGHAQITSGAVTYPPFSLHSAAARSAVHNGSAAQPERYCAFERLWFRGQWGRTKSRAYSDTHNYANPDPDPDPDGSAFRHCEV